MSEWFFGLTRNKLLIIIMILIGLALVLDAAIRTFRNQAYVPTLFISIAGFVILGLIYRLWGKDW